MSSATPHAPVITSGQNPFQLSQSGSSAEQSTLSGPATGGQSSAGTSGGLASAAGTAWAWILAFAVLGFLLWLVNKSKIGHVLLYYLLVLATVSTLLMNYRWLSGALAPFTNLAGSGGGEGQATRPLDKKGT